VKSVERHWLEAVPWESVVDINKALCQAQQIEQVIKAPALATARQCWEQAVKPMSLADVLQVCRQCHDAGPFVFNNGNTFGSVAKTLINDWLKNLPPLEAEIVRATVSHYVVGLVGKRELLDILKHFEPVLKKAASSKLAETPVSTNTTTPPPVQTKPVQAAPIQTAPASQAV
jgi:hypothetical protein